MSLKKRDTHAAEPRGAVLHPRTPEVAITRHLPSPALTPFVRHFWFIRWRLEGLPAHRQGTLTLPAVNLVIEAERDSVSGFWTTRFERELSGDGAVFGVLFRPAGFQPFWGRSMHLLVDRSPRVAEVLGRGCDELRALAFSGAPDAEVLSAYEAFLLASSPSLSAEGAEVDRWVSQVEGDPAIGRAEALAQRVGVGLRTLQRLMRYHVGVGPKQVIRRHRLLEAAARVAGGEAIDHAQMALDLGYSDQAHFVRDFSAAIGASPGRYAKKSR